MSDMLFLFLIATVIGETFTWDLEMVGQELDRKYDFDFLKDMFKLKIDVNPHPMCALEGEKCSLDNNCCRGMECKVSVDRKGVAYTCQWSAEEAGANHDADDEQHEPTNEDDVYWSVDGGLGKDSAEISSSILQDIYRSRLENVKKEEDKILNDQYYLLKELQKPLTLEEMRELLQAKQVEDYKREQKLISLRNWAKQVEEEEKLQAEMQIKLKKTAKERVAKVLKEEERQKLEMFKNVQHAMQKFAQTKRS